MVREIIEKYTPLCEQEQRDRAQMLRYIDICGESLTRDDTMAHFTASAWVVDPTRRLALMEFHNTYQSWAWTGGHADGDGDLAAVALREALEETGVHAYLASERPISIETLCVEGHMKRGAFVSPHIHMNVSYLLEADPNEEIRVKADENSGVMWMPFEDVSARCSEVYMRGIYAKLMERAAGSGWR